MPVPLSQKTTAEMTDAVMKRRAGIRAVLEAAAVPDPAQDCRWISASWLSTWADSEEAPPPIDNAPLLCEHGELDPTKVPGTRAAASAVALAGAAWHLHLWAQQACGNDRLHATV